MPTIADFAIVQNTGVTLDAGDSTHTYPDFNAPDVNVGSSGVLAFRVNPNNPPVTLELILNGASLLTETFQSDTQRGYHEIVPPNVIEDVDNVLTIVRSGSGEVTVRDVYLLFQAVI